MIKPSQLFTAICMAVIFLVAPLATADKQTETIKRRLLKSYPDLKIHAIRPSPMPGLYELVVGRNVLYVSADGKYIIIGELIDTATKNNLTRVANERVMRSLRKVYLRQLRSINEKDMIIIGPKRPKRTITVFTDVDCPVCARFHRDVPLLNRNGVKIRYLLYSRAGITGPDGKKTRTYLRSVAVWCAKDRVKAIGWAKAGGPLTMRTCPNPVAKHIALGRKMGLRGTPMIVTDKGIIINGYSNAAGLLQILGIKMKK